MIFVLCVYFVRNDVQEEPVMPLGNHTWNLGDITGDIYFDRLTRQDGRTFLSSA